jgi:hypothetical protein
VSAIFNGLTQNGDANLELEINGPWRQIVITLYLATMSLTAEAQFRCNICLYKLLGYEVPFECVLVVNDAEWTALKKL